MTCDIDIWFRSTHENAARLIKVLDEFGFPSLGISVDDFLGEDQVVQLGYPPRRIDIMTSLTGLTFAEAWDRRLTGSLGGISIAYLSREDFIRNKRAAARPKDLVDADSIERA